ncbi:MAG TPA: cytochrome c [Bryobacteraceae bacterium]|nr:cytochrome c [Bryobacteraceae bacterium]
MRFWLIFAVSMGVVQAHDIITTKITFSREISRIVYKRCATCHRDGGSAFSLMTYAEARPWAKAIKEEVLERRMPPWEAIKGFGEFREDRGLTAEEIETIAAWVEGGAPEGEPKYLPPSPRLADWQDPVAPKGTSEVALADGSKLLASSQVLAIRAKALKPGASVQIVAIRPDSSVEPLIWLYKYNPAFQRTYFYVAPLSLPAGTKIEMNPPAAGTVGLFVKHAASAKNRSQ